MSNVKATTLLLSSEDSDFATLDFVEALESDPLVRAAEWVDKFLVIVTFVRPEDAEAFSQLFSEQFGDLITVKPFIEGNFLADYTTEPALN